jgi:hypothetical protein
MIILKEGVNYAVFTFNENIPVPYTDQYFLWKITNSLTQEEILFTNNVDSSANGDRFNQFAIQIGITASSYEDLNQSVLAFTASGQGGFGYDSLSQWTYDAYVCEGPMPTTGTVSFPATFSFVESGRIIMSL